MRKIREPAANSQYGTFPQGAAFLGLSLSHFRRAARSNAFPVYLYGGRWPRIKFVEIELWVQSKRVEFDAAASHDRAVESAD